MYWQWIMVFRINVHENTEMWIVGYTLYIV
uniref:Uncharacterized protein n=1 Tax=Arundo donax TaxID=35708 RepID=A0A0A8Z6T0_ARUDO